MRAEAAEAAWQADIMRDLFLPFRLPASLEPTWRTVRVRSLARQAYEHRIVPDGTLNPNVLAALVKGLIEAGCTDVKLLEHLRGAGPHYLGCWGVDAVFSKG
jgi:hypothetical protein